uniref:CRIB domain-containing protein n=1 Tax=Kalanchoe fedtschenkoi TaxID=63787 RepID=A0A7N0UIF3_KALFE
MTTKMKGLLKGLRYISQIFDEDKEPEMQIGFPTDVKHVAHIGCDGPSVNSPSWMDSFKPDQDSMSGPLAADDSSLKGSLHASSPARDLPDMPRSSRRSSGEIFSTDSSKKEKSEKTSSRHSRKSHSGGGSKELSDNSSSGRSSSRSQPLSESAPGSESPSHGLPDIPKKSRRKKSKDSSQGGSSKSSSRTAKAIAEASTYTSPFSDPGSGSVSTDLYSCPSPDLQRSDEANDRNRLNGFA